MLQTSSPNISRIVNTIGRPSFSYSNIVPVEESSLEDELEITANGSTFPKYSIIEKGSRKNTDILMDGQGFSYTVKCSFPKSRTWMCSTNRNGLNPCRGTVFQRDDSFVMKKPHNHPPNYHIEMHLKLRNEVKQKALQNMFESAKHIVEDVFLNYHRKNPKFDFPQVDNVVRLANRTRQSSRPMNPKDSNFRVNEAFIPKSFYRGEVFCGAGNNLRRHLVFMTDTQVGFLSNAKRWYVDGTFKIVDKKLFTQLFSIHAFIRKGSSIKQVPLAFVFMTSRKTSDYLAVFRNILSVLPFTRVKEIVSDYEKAIWKAVKVLNDDCYEKLFKNVKHFGCAFHFTQAIFERIKKLGLAGVYNKNRKINKFCRRLMCLHLVHYTDVNYVMNCLYIKAETSSHKTMLLQLLNYVQKTWVESAVWEPKYWCGFNQPIRTNNDAEGWHLKLNRRGKDGSPSFYVLLELLHKEATLISIQSILLSQKKLKRSQKKMYKSIQAQLFSFWKEFTTRNNTNNPMNPWELLKLVSFVYSSNSQ